MTIRTARGLAAALVMAAALALSGCAALSPVQSEVLYHPADGVPVDMGAVEVDNLLIVATAKDGPGVVSGSVVNNSDKTVTIAFTDQVAGSTAGFDIPAFATAQVSTETRKVQLAKVSGGPGTIIKMAVSSATSGTSTVDVPVLGEQSYYATLQPTTPPAPSTPAPTATTAPPTAALPTTAPPTTAAG